MCAGGGCCGASISDVFLVTGRRRTVCELCTPRAVHEGWLRETDRQSVSLPPMRPRRGRSLLDRLRQVGRLGVSSSDAEDLPVAYEQREEPPTGEPQPYDFREERPAAGAAPVAPPRGIPRQRPSRTAASRGARRATTEGTADRRTRSRRR